MKDDASVDTTGKLRDVNLRHDAHMSHPVRVETGYRVLIAEDERIVALALGELLTGMGYRIVGNVATSDEVVRLAREIRPDVVLMDISLEGTPDGIFAADLIQSAGLAPVVFLTAYSDSGTLRRAGEVQPYGYLLKPLQERELRVSLELAVARFRAERNLDSGAEQGAAASQIGGLQGSVAVCSWCGQIRTDAGLWISPSDEALGSTSGAEVTHVMCPKCATEKRASSEP